jgi:hypothetical protein
LLVANSPHPASNTEAGILTRLIQTREEPLSRGTAQYFLSLRFDDGDIARMNDLSEIARVGQLSTADQAELDSYIHVINLLAVMQSKARQSLRISQVD